MFNLFSWMPSYGMSENDRLKAINKAYEEQIDELNRTVRKLLIQNTEIRNRNAVLTNLYLDTHKKINTIVKEERNAAEFFGLEYKTLGFLLKRANGYFAKMIGKHKIMRVLTDKDYE